MRVLDGHGGGSGITGYVILVYEIAFSGGGHIRTVQVVVEGAGEYVGKGVGFHAACLHIGAQQVNGVTFPYLTVALSFPAGMTVIGAHQHPVRSIMKVKTCKSVVVTLEISAVAVGVDYSEIRFDAEGSGEVLKQGCKVIYGAAMTQSVCHDVAFAVHLRGGDIIGLKVIGSSVHDCETDLVNTYPCLFTFPVGGVEEGHVGHLALHPRGYVFHFIVQSGGIAVFPQNRLAGSSQSAGNYSRCTGGGGDRRHEYQRPEEYHTNEFHCAKLGKKEEKRQFSTR